MKPDISSLADDGDCTCHLDLLVSDLTPDSELPAAAGGVQEDAIDLAGGEEEVDGCDAEFDDGIETADDQLPPAVGGVG